MFATWHDSTSFRLFSNFEQKFAPTSRGLDFGTTMTSPSYSLFGFLVLERNWVFLNRDKSDEEHNQQNNSEENKHNQEGPSHALPSLEPPDKVIFHHNHDHHHHHHCDTRHVTYVTKG